MAQHSRSGCSTAARTVHSPRKQGHVGNGLGLRAHSEQRTRRWSVAGYDTQGLARMRRTNRMCKALRPARRAGVPNTRRGAGQRAEGGAASKKRSGACSVASRSTIIMGAAAAGWRAAARSVQMNIASSDAEGGIFTVIRGGGKIWAATELRQGAGFEREWDGSGKGDCKPQGGPKEPQSRTVRDEPETKGSERGGGGSKVMGRDAIVTCVNKSILSDAPSSAIIDQLERQGGPAMGAQIGRNALQWEA
ncbi:hypothetical protein K438DRAFT_1773338 [Mycena galopus ATCC 62051]|nr:hypothetical protein K438DRAFT_1773338 [Mycena galopus ATCC 62051]